MRTDCQIEIVNASPVDIVGLSCRTTLESSVVDCPRFWSEVFGPRMQEVPTYAGAAYGVAVMAADDVYDYWGGLTHYPGQPVPAGMSTMRLAGGLYAVCRLEGGFGLALAYHYLYHALGIGPEHEFVLDQPCYEQFPPDHMQTGLIDLYLPIKAVGAPDNSSAAD
ncbi:GyrI-like domain-containing protein [Deltaproteobacteria bacterium OttesenSCG-928-K17]|nr:GyrI-like domain-containing protein [Deltaproteobacteria bacterium OttesenSCG-928-K17]